MTKSLYFETWAKCQVKIPKYSRAAKIKVLKGKFTAISLGTSYGYELFFNGKHS